jgi:ADP-ribosylglycohydrolase
MKRILLLEDNEERIAAFATAVPQLGEDFELKVWRDAHSMRKECEAFFPAAALISLDHDLNAQPDGGGDPGCGLDVAKFLADFLPVCPVLLHSSNTDRVYSMQNEFRFAGWSVDRVGPVGSGWIATSWLPKVRELLIAHSNTWRADLPLDHAARVGRMLLSLDGLGIGDALGEMFAYRPAATPARLRSNDLPSGPWFHTDDTEMAISIAGVLRSHGHLNQDALAKRFYRRWERDPERGYGKMTRIQMREMLLGENWRVTAPRAFGGRGSMGNGGAMRVAPLGGYFAEDPELAAREAEASAVVTHTHPEGVAGAIATAVAASMAWQLRDMRSSSRAKALFFAEIERLTPSSEVRRKLTIASQTPASVESNAVAKALGKGELVTAPDTVPFCLWAAARHLDDFVTALSETIAVGGDCDTNAAIVGGIVALSVGQEGIPKEWMQAREQIAL